MLAAAGVVLGTLSAACRDEPVAPTQATVAASLDQASLRVGDVAGARIVKSHRAVLHGDIAHYTFDVAVGPGEHDLIRLHLVVRERRPNRPVDTEDAVFLLPGDPNSFEGVFIEPLISSVPRWDQSVTAFLAENGIDVWGMDYDWALVPAATTDFSFERGWGGQWEMQTVEKGLGVARRIRVSTGQGYDRLHLLGFSYGADLAYRVVGDETQQPLGKRHVKGMIQVDELVMPVNADSEAAAACALVPVIQSDLDTCGPKVDASDYAQIGDLAASAPDEVSPYSPPLTNWQFALAAGASGDQHFVGGTFDESGTPTGLRYTDPGLWVDVLRAIPHNDTPRPVWLDWTTLECNRFDYHLGQVTIPILYIGAAGGFGGRLAYHDATLTGSKDITRFVVQLLPDGQQAYDFGHVDLLTAGHAKQFVWRPLLHWLLAHRSDRSDFARAEQ
jgi:hypothetical protein